MELHRLKRFMRLYQSFFVQGGIIVATLLAIFFGIVPMAQKSFDLMDEMNGLSSDVAALQEKSSILQGLDALTLQNDLTALTAAVPADKSIPTVMSTINAAAGQSGVTLSDFTLAKAGKIATNAAEVQTVNEAKVGSFILPVSITAAGSLGQIQSFLTTIEGVKRYLRISSLNVTIRGSEAEVSLELDAFYVPYPVAVGSVGQPISDLTPQEQSTIAKTVNLPILASSSVSQNTGTAPVGGVGKADPFSP